MDALHTRRACLAAAAALALAAPWQMAAAQAWPTKPVTIVVPFPPGGGTDIIAREVSQKVAANTGWTFVIDNKPGAGGNLGIDAVAKSPADGYTIVIGQTSNLAINPTLYSRLPYDPQKDLAPIVLLANAPLVMVTGASSPYKTAGEVVAAAKAKPGKLSYASGGIGGTHHLSGALFEHTAGIDMIHAPYKSGGAGATAADGFLSRNAATAATVGGRLERTARCYPILAGQLWRAIDAKVTATCGLAGRWANRRTEWLAAASAVLAGSLWLGSAMAAVAGGQADLIAFGRAFISNPDLVARIASGAEWAPNLGGMAHWYSPISLSEIELSVAERVVTTVACRGSPAALLQRVRQKRPFPDCEWLVRDIPGICSQHSAELQARPPPRMLSSPPCSRICTDPPPPPLDGGLAPQPGRQSASDQVSISGDAVQLPLSVSRSSARARRGAARSKSPTSGAERRSRRGESGRTAGLHRSRSPEAGATRGRALAHRAR